jgi:hypothetical protein
VLLTFTVGDDVMSTALSTLKFVNAKRLVSKTDPTQFRRQKMIKKLDEQIEMASALVEGRLPLITRTRRVLDRETSERQLVESTASVRQWWFVSETGKTAVQLRYGSRVITLAKNRNAVEVSGNTELLAVLQTLKTAVAAGELDQEIAVAADMVRARFKK